MNGSWRDTRSAGTARTVPWWDPAGGSPVRAGRLALALLLSLALVGLLACTPSVTDEAAEDASEIATVTAGVQDPPPPESEPAWTRLEFSGEGFTAEYDAWNCEGLEGEWKMRGEIDLPEFGTIDGEASFTMPSRPESGPWNSEPFEYTMSGTLDAEDAIIDITYQFEGVTFTIIDSDDGPTLGDVGGTGMARGTVKVTTPDMSFVASESYAPYSLVPALIQFGEHPECP